jgi:outer membrane receptor protein involved in Fe transport
MLPCCVPARRRALLVLAVALPSLTSLRSAVAQDEPRLDLATLELEELLDLPVTIATKALARVSQVPATVSVVTDEQIRDHGWTSINQILASLPGFARSQEYERRTTSARGVFEGWNANHLLVLVDGLPFNDADVQAAYTWELTSPDFFRQVEVVRGPASALYGSNAVNGAIGLQTVRAADLGGALRARTRFGLGSNQASVVGGHEGERGEVVVGYSRFVTQGENRSDLDLSGRLDADGELAHLRLDDHATYHHAMISARAGGRLEGLSAQLHLQEQITGSGHGWLLMIPEQPDLLWDQRTVGSLKYEHEAGPVTFEHALQWQHMRTRFDVHIVPPGGYEDYYPLGVEETARYGVHNGFARSQATVALPSRSSVLAGVEYRLLIARDELHQLDADPVTFEPYDRLQDVGGYYEAIDGEPVHRFAAFAQGDSGDLILDWLRLYAGLRYDGMVARYIGLEDGAPAERSFHELSPRLGVVLSPIERLTVKLMAGRAFRTPAAVELFSSNSWLSATDPTTLQPETDVTYEAAVDAAPHEAVRLRGNVFHSDRRHHIGYSQEEAALLTNLYSSRRLGFETEAMSKLDLGPLDLEAFASYSYVRLLDEEAEHPSVSAEDRLTNVPAQLVKLGGRLVGDRWSAALSAYAQGRTFRRASERATPDYYPYRPTSVPGHLTLDAAAGYDVLPGLRLGLQAVNLLDAEARLAAPTDAPFDYRAPGRRVMLTLELQP